MANATATRVHIIVHPGTDRDSEHVCDDCLMSDDQAEGTLPNYGDESCDRCDFHSGDDDDEGED